MKVEWRAVLRTPQASDNARQHCDKILCTDDDGTAWGWPGTGGDAERNSSELIATHPELICASLSRGTSRRILLLVGGR
jgi:hypothetical protein